MPKFFKSFLILSFLIAVLILPYFVFAQNNAMDRLENIGTGEGRYTGADNTTVAEIIGTAVNAALGLLGIIFVILIIYGGYKWMTAAGNEEKSKEGTDIIRRAIIGLIIVAGSWAIWAFVSEYLLG